MASSVNHSDETSASVPVEASDNEQSSVQQAPSQVRPSARERFGGMHWGAAFLGFAVTTFFTILFFGIVGAVVGAVGYQMGAKVPKIGSALSGTTQQLGVGTVAGTLIALFLAYLIGGYTAGRLARFDGAKNGARVVVWTIIVAIVLGIAGAIFGSKFNVAGQLNLKIDTGTLTTAGLVSLVVTLLVMLISSMIGGQMGARYHRRIDQAVAEEA